MKINLNGSTIKGQKKIICAIINLCLRRRCLVGSFLCKYFPLRKYFYSFNSMQLRRFLSQSEKNYFRLSRLLVNVGSQALRETFDKIHSPEGLETVLVTPPALCELESVQKKKILKQLQWKNLYPDVKTSVSSENFDITLLTVLLRTTCGLTPSATGWDELPSPTDICLVRLISLASYTTEIQGMLTLLKRRLTMRHLIIPGCTSAMRW